MGGDSLFVTTNTRIQRITFKVLIHLEQLLHASRLPDVCRSRDPRKCDIVLEEHLDVPKLVERVPVHLLVFQLGQLDVVLRAPHRQRVANVHRRGLGSVLLEFLIVTSPLDTHIAEFPIGFFDLSILQHAIVRHWLPELRRIDLVRPVQEIVHDIPAAIELLHHVAFAQQLVRKQAAPALNPHHDLLQIHAGLVDPIEQNGQPFREELALQHRGKRSQIDAVAPFQNGCEVVDVLLVARIDLQRAEPRDQLRKRRVLQREERSPRSGAFRIEERLQLGENGFELAQIGQRLQIGRQRVGEVRKDVGIEAWEKRLEAKQRREEENGLRSRVGPALDLGESKGGRKGYGGENARCDGLDHLLEQHVGVPNLPRGAEDLLEVEEMVLIERVERRGKRGLDAREQRGGEDGDDEKAVFVVVFLCARVQPIIIEQMRFRVFFLFLHQNNRLHIVHQFHETRRVLRSTHIPVLTASGFHVANAC